LPARLLAGYADRRRERSLTEFRMSIPEPEVIEVTSSRIACDGGGAALGHPRVWLTIDPRTGFVECGYCDRKFVLKPGAAAADH
jgi:uncharacterized Zn-finger protein